MVEHRRTQKGWITQRWEKDTRYYEAHLHQDLWGGWVLTHVWGQRGTRLGRIRHLPCASYDEGLLRLVAVDQRRRQRGYCRTGYQRTGESDKDTSEVTTGKEKSSGVAPARSGFNPIDFGE
jgi:hypothetical protein